MSDNSLETFDDIVAAGCQQTMSHQERYEFRKKRVYFANKSSEVQGNGS
ncbi:MAG: hypothetical protein AB4058_07205 [Microcystaceae cyanobacterium]